MITKRWIAIAAAAVVLPLTAATPVALAQSAPLPAQAPRVQTCPVQGGLCEGTPGNDTLIAGQLPDRVVGGAGDDDIELDIFFPQGSSDVGEGGPGRDCIDGGGGNDTFLGGPGDDNVPCEFTAFVDPQAAMTGGPGDDYIDGGPGDDSMNGIFDSDTLIGGEGDDLLNDGFLNDADKLSGGPGTDTLNAADAGGDDVIDGGPGNDTCIGDPGDTFRNCEKINRIPLPLIVDPAANLPLPRALGVQADPTGGRGR